MNIDFKVNLWTLLLLGLMAILFFTRLGMKNEAEKWLNNYNVLKGEHTELVSEHDSMIIHKNGIIELTKKELRDALESDSIQRELVEEYKAAAAAVKVETVFKTDTLYIEVPIKVDNDTSIKFSNKCLSLDLSVFNGGLSLDNILIENRQDILLGERKTSMWKTEQAIMVRNTNPCIETTNVTTYMVSVEKKWHEKWWITVPASFGAGFIAGSINK